VVVCPMVFVRGLSTSAVGLALLGCSGDVKPRTPEVPEVGPANVTVVMASVKLGEDCGSNPVPVLPTAMADQEFQGESKRSIPRGESACRQTAMQLSVTSQAGGLPSELRIEKVEVFDEADRLIGEMVPREPMIWSNGSYVPWNQQVAPNQQLSVSYALGHASLGSVYELQVSVYKVKAVVSVGGTKHTLSKQATVFAETILPADVET
jgi:hypothetical protein